jgi:hypothetical protein
MTTLQAALRYAERGWYVFPLAPRGKEPVTPNGYLDSTLDPNLIRQWWQRIPDANLGVATGKSGLAVIDIDSLEGAAHWARIEAHHGPANTLMAETGRGGIHLIYAGTIPSTANRVAPGIDTRGDGGYIVAPPSIHPNGTPYRWSEYARTPVGLPRWVGTLVTTPARVYEPIGVPRISVGDSAYGRAAARRAAQDVIHAGEGQRNHTLNQAAFGLGQLVAGGELLHATAKSMLEQAGLQAGLTEREVTKTITSGLQAGAKEPRNAPARAA